MPAGKRVIATLSIRAVSIAAQLGLFVLIARVTDLGTVGVFALASATWVLMRALLPMGWNIAVLKRTAVLLETGSGRDAFRLMMRAVIETLMLGTLLVGAFAALLLGLNDRQIVLWLLIASVGLVWANVAILVAYLRAYGYLVTSQVFDGVVIYVIPLTVCVASVAYIGRLDIVLVVGSHLLSGILAWICLFALVVRLLRASNAEMGPTILSFADERQLARRLWWNQVFSALSSRAPVLLTTPLAGVATTAIIETGLRTQLVGATLAWAGGTVASPRYAVAHHHGRPDAALVLSAVTWATMLPSALVAGVLIVWGDPVLQILGEAYAKERIAVALMATAAVAELPAACAGYFLMMTGREKIASLSTLLQLLVLSFSALLLGPQWGAFGIAGAVFVAACCRSLVVLISLRLSKVESPLSPKGLIFLLRAIIPDRPKPRHRKGD